MTVCLLGTAVARGDLLFQDEFETPGNQLDLASWTTNTQFGTVVGRTQLTNWVTPGAGGKFVVGANGAQLAVDTYDPNGRGRILGTNAYTYQSFAPGDDNGVSFTTELQLTSLQPGLVYGMYLYGGANNQSDEIDIELLTNTLQPGAPLQVELNRFTANSPDTGDGGFATLPTGFDPLAKHSWTIDWSQRKIQYLVDGMLLGIALDLIPQAPLQVNVIAFAPSSNWGAAYSSSLQPTSIAGDNQSFSALLTGVTVTSTPEPGTWLLISTGIAALFLRRRAAATIDRCRVARRGR